MLVPFGKDLKEIIFLRKILFTKCQTKLILAFYNHHYVLVFIFKKQKVPPDAAPAVLRMDSVETNSNSSSVATTSTASLREGIQLTFE